MVFNPDTAPNVKNYIPSAREASTRLSVLLTEERVRTAEALESAIAGLAGVGSGLMVMPDTFTNAQRRRIIALAERHRLPATYPLRTYAESGGLLAYGPDSTNNFVRAATYVDRIPSLGMAEELVRSAQKQGDPSGEYLGHTVYLRTLWGMGVFIEARSHCEKALKLYNPIDRKRLISLTAEDPQCATLIFSSLLLLCLGFLDQARNDQEKAISEARNGGHAHIITYTVGNACIYNTLLPDLEALAGQIDEVMISSSKYGLAFWDAWGTIFRGHSLGQAGRPTDGIELIRKGSAFLDMIGMVTFRPFRLTVLAEALSAARLFSEGLRRLDEAIDLMAITQDRWLEAEIYRVRRELLLKMGDKAAAQASFDRGLAWDGRG